MWKVVGCRKDYTLSVGQTKRNVQDAAQKKARKSTDCTTVRAGRKSEASSRRSQGNGNSKEGLDVAKRNHNAPLE